MEQAFEGLQVSDLTICGDRKRMAHIEQILEEITGKLNGLTGFMDG